jgi:hypothetical protein
MKKSLLSYLIAAASPVAHNYANPIIPATLIPAIFYKSLSSKNQK